MLVDNNVPPLRTCLDSGTVVPDYLIALLHPDDRDLIPSRGSLVLVCIGVQPPYIFLVFHIALRGCSTLPLLRGDFHLTSSLEWLEHHSEDSQLLFICSDLDIREREY